MPAWLGVALFLLLVAGVVLAFFVARSKGLGRFQASMAEARAEGAAELRAQLGQHVNVSVDNSRRVLSPGGGSDDPVPVSELVHIERERLRAIARKAVRSDVLRLDPADVDDVDDDDYAAALSRAMDHDDRAAGYDASLYPPLAGVPRLPGALGQRGEWAAPRGPIAGSVRPRDTPGPFDSPMNGRGPGE